MSFLISLQNSIANMNPVFAQVTNAVSDTAVQVENSAAGATASPAQKALIYAAAFTAIGFAAIGSAYGCGVSASSAMGVWKKCYLQNKPAPFQLLIFTGAPLSQTIYGMILMFIIMGAAESPMVGSWISYMVIGSISGIAMGISAAWQGIAAAGACDTFGETGKGFANQLMALGIVETIAIFCLAFAIVLLSIIGA